MNQVDPAPIAPYLSHLFEHGGTDLHLSSGAPPMIRLDGHIEPIAGVDPLHAADLERLLQALLGPDLWDELRANKEVDFAFDLDERVRFRGNAFGQRGSLAAAFRVIPNDIPSFDDLGLPSIVEELVQRPQGLVLVTGPTGSGKSTSLASMIDWINANRRCHIITIEDPVEYLHNHRRSAVNQREIGPDATDFHSALRAALREDPDVLLVGEMRDPESIGVALSIAETGHLVFATLHTNDTAQALDRIVDVFPAERRDQIQVQLASTLLAVIYQRLLPRKEGGLVAAFEVMRANHAVRNLIREGKTNQLRNVIATHQSEGMQTLEMALTDLVAEGVIDFETALGFSLYPKELRRRAGRVGIAPTGPAPSATAAVLAGLGEGFDDDDFDAPAAAGADAVPAAGGSRRGLRRRS